MKILDEGKLKYCSETIKMKKPDYVYRFENELMAMELLYRKREAAGQEYQQKIVKTHACNCIREKQNYENYCNQWEREYEGNPEKEFLLKYLFTREISNKFEFDRIASYYKIIPFTPSVMINISPNWGDKPQRACKLKELINSYMSEGWYDKWQYVIECGSEGTHIHAHIVAHMNVERLKSVESHLRRGNHTRQLQKWAKKIEGMGGTIEGVSVQKCILRNEQLVKDKLDYLIEEKKPVGHKNHHIVPNGLISGEL